MTRTRFSLLHTLACGGLLVSCLAPSAAGQALTNTVVYDVQKGEFCWLEKVPSLPMATRDAIRAGKTECPAANFWKPPADFFRAGSLVELVIIKGKFLSTYTAVVNATPIQTAGPVIRGIDDAQTVTPPEKPKEAITKSALTPDLLTNPARVAQDATDALDKLKALHVLALEAIAAVRRDNALGIILGPPPTPSLVSPGLRLRRLEAFARFLATQTTSAVPTKPPYIDQGSFVRFVESTDQMIVNVKQLNARIQEVRPALPRIAPALDAMKRFLEAATDADLRLMKTQAKQTQTERTQTETALAPLRDYLPGGKEHTTVQTAYDEISRDFADLDPLIISLNESLLVIFENVNTLYEMSESPTAFEIFIGQWTANQRVDFTVTELPGFRLYGFAARLESGGGAAGNQAANATAGGVRVDPSLLGNNAPAPEAGKTGNAAAQEKAKEAKKEAMKEVAANPEPPKGKTLISRKAFTVHEYARASITSGFVFGSLRNREFGIEQVRAVDDEGKPLSKDGKPVFDRAPVAGESKRPQTHYYVGLLYYFRERDLFPEAQPRSHYGVLIGYGVTEQRNFFLGLTAETKWGLNASIGWHLGREKVLAPGVVTRAEASNTKPYTRLADDATTVTTVDRTKINGVFGSVGFDLRVFAKVFGAATGTVKS